MINKRKSLAKAIVCLYCSAIIMAAIVFIRFIHYISLYYLLNKRYIITCKRRWEEKLCRACPHRNLLRFGLTIQSGLRRKGRRLSKPVKANEFTIKK
jgi:hypothetical protein